MAKRVLPRATLCCKLKANRFCSIKLWGPRLEIKTRTISDNKPILATTQKLHRRSYPNSCNKFPCIREKSKISPFCRQIMLPLQTRAAWLIKQAAKFKIKPRQTCRCSNIYKAPTTSTKTWTCNLMGKVARKRTVFREAPKIFQIITMWIWLTMAGTCPAKSLKRWIIWSINSLRTFKSREVVRSPNWQPTGNSLLPIIVSELCKPRTDFFWASHLDEAPQQVETIRDIQ